MLGGPGWEEGLQGDWPPYCPGSDPCCWELEVQGVGSQPLGCHRHCRQSRRLPPHLHLQRGRCLPKLETETKFRETECWIILLIQRISYIYICMYVYTVYLFIFEHWRQCCKLVRYLIHLIGKSRYCHTVISSINCILPEFTEMFLLRYILLSRFIVSEKICITHPNRLR